MICTYRHLVGECNVSVRYIVEQHNKKLRNEPRAAERAQVPTATSASAASGALPAPNDSGETVARRTQRQSHAERMHIPRPQIQSELPGFAQPMSGTADSGALPARDPWGTYNNVRDYQEWLYVPSSSSGERCKDKGEHNDSGLTAAASGASSASATLAPPWLRDCNDGDDRGDMSDFWRKGPGQFWKRHSS